MDLTCVLRTAHPMTSKVVIARRLGHVFGSGKIVRRCAPFTTARRSTFTGRTGCGRREPLVHSSLLATRFQSWPEELVSAAVDLAAHACLRLLCRRLEDAEETEQRDAWPARGVPRQRARLAP